MNLFSKIALATALASAIAGCSETQDTVSEPTSEQKPVAEATVSENQRFLAFAESIAQNQLRADPLQATELGVSEAVVGEYFADKLPSASLASIEESKAYQATLAAELAKFDASALSGTALTTYQVLSNRVALMGKFKPYVTGSYRPLSYFSLFPVTQLSGKYIDIARALQTQHPLTNEQDAKDYIARLQQFEIVLKDLAKVVINDVDMGLLPPDFVVRGAINVVNQMSGGPAAENPLVTSFADRLTADSQLSEDAVADLKLQVTSVVQQQVYPGYAELKQALEAILPRASDNAGIWDLENGAEIYQLALENFGATGKSAAEIHALGLAEVDRIQGEMAAILDAQGLDSSDVIAAYNALTENPEYLYPNTDEGRAQLLADLNTDMDTVTALLPTILHTLPKAPVEVRRIPEYEQENAPGGYYTSPSLDGSRPGIYWINLIDTADWPSFTLPTLTYHEASPGHHLQVTIAQEVKDMPMVRNMMWSSAYGEGWALYAEVLAKEMGLYDDNPLGDLGRLQSELFRAARLVVDTGLHYKQWSREEAIEYMYGAIGGSKDAITREVERYSVWPGQACSYKLGQLKILELRAKAQAVLGEQFDLAAFNDQVLIHGSVTLPVLEDIIMDWIEQQGA